MDLGPLTKLTPEEMEYQALLYQESLYWEAATPIIESHIWQSKKQRMAYFALIYNPKKTLPKFRIKIWWILIKRELRWRGLL